MLQQIEPTEGEAGDAHSCQRHQNRSGNASASFPGRGLMDLPYGATNKWCRDV